MTHRAEPSVTHGPGKTWRGQRPTAYLMLQHLSTVRLQRAPAHRCSGKRRFDHLPELVWSPHPSTASHALLHLMWASDKVRSHGPLFTMNNAGVGASGSFSHWPAPLLWQGGSRPHVQTLPPPLENDLRGSFEACSCEIARVVCVIALETGWVPSSYILAGVQSYFSAKVACEPTFSPSTWQNRELPLIESTPLGERSNKLHATAPAHP